MDKYNWNRIDLEIDYYPVPFSFSDVNTLLAPASVQLPNENAWCTYKSGQGYVASRSHFPNVTGEQAQWWFWWHSAAGVRYSLWHPWAHVDVSSTYADKFDDPSLNNTQKLIGSIHHITEIIGEPRESFDIHWKEPSFFGLDESKFDQVGIVASACGEIYIPQNSPVKAVDMIHLFYKTDNGLELRSRYYLGNNIQVEIPVLGSLLPVNTIANLLGLKNVAVGQELSYLQFHHDQQVSFYAIHFEILSLTLLTFIRTGNDSLGVNLARGLCSLWSLGSFHIRSLTESMNLLQSNLPAPFSALFDLFSKVLLLMRMTFTIMHY